MPEDTATAKDEPNQHSGLTDRMFEVIKLLVGILLTGSVGTCISTSFQSSSQLEQKRQESLKLQTELATKLFDEITILMDSRHYAARRVLGAMQDRSSVEQLNGAWDTYEGTVRDWNIKRNRYDALIKANFGRQMKIKFYDENWRGSENASITGKFISLHERLRASRDHVLKGEPPGNLEDIQKLVDSLGGDIYYFDFEMISQIQKGAVGTFVPPQTGAEEPGGLSP
jgi:hypothetical protein